MYNPCCQYDGIALPHNDRYNRNESIYRQDTQ